MQHTSDVRQIIDQIMKKYGYRHHYQVAEFFGVTAQTLSGWLKNNTIPHKHLLMLQDEFTPTLHTEELEHDFSKKIIHLLQSKGKSIVIFTCTMSLVAFVYFKFIATPLFTAKASVIPIGDNGSDLAGLAGTAAQIGLNFPVNNETIAWDELFLEILRSNGVQRRLLDEKFNISTTFEQERLYILLTQHLNLEKKNNKEQQLKIDKYLNKRIRVSKTRFSPLINIEIDAFNANLAANMIDKLIKISNEMQVNIKTRQMGQKRQFIEERIEEVKVALASAESRLQSFQERNRRSNASPSLLLEESRFARDVTLQNNLYLTLKTQYEEAKIEEVERTPMVETVDAPIPPLEQAGPRVFINTVMTAVFSFVLLFLSLFFKEFLKPIRA